MWSRRSQFGMRCLAIASLAIAAGGVFYERGIKRGSARETADLHGRIVEAQRLIAEVDTLDIRQHLSASEGIPLSANLPSGSAQVWLPELVKKHFTNAGLDVSIVRLNSLLDIPETRNFQRGYWSVGVAVEENGKNIPDLLTAVAQFERQNTFIKVLDFSVAQDPENPGKRIAGVNLTTLVAR